MTMKTSIRNLAGMVSGLKKKRKDVFGRIYDIRISEGSLIVPDSMESWIKNRFGSKKLVENQSVVKVLNKITGEESLFNEIRSKRPVQTNEAKGLNSIKVGRCSFCEPEKNTPEDVFGRIRGRHCITASNVAKYDKWHGLIVFRNHNPFEFGAEMVSDYIDTAMNWFNKVMENDKNARFPFFMWNCLWRAGASINHGHAQVTVAERPYSALEMLGRCAYNYRKKHSSVYFDDLFLAHESVGLGLRNKKSRLMAYLTPVKDNEIMILADSVGEDLKKSIYGVLKSLYGKGNRGFNVAVVPFPIYASKSSGGSKWEGLPVVARVVDRGNLDKKTSDIGSMELYAGSVISSDPFNTIRNLKV